MCSSDLTININAKKESTKSWRWKDGTPEQWVKYNNQVQDMWNTTDRGKKDSNRLNEVITRSLNDTIGKRWHQSNQKTMVTNDEIKKAKKTRKKQKKAFNEACKTNNITSINQTKKEYIASQKTIRYLVEKQTRNNINKISNQIIKEGGANSNLFWKIRKQKRKVEDAYNTINEEGEILTDPNQAKQHIANFF